MSALRRTTAILLCVAVTLPLAADEGARNPLVAGDLVYQSQGGIVAWRYSGMRSRAPAGHELELRWRALTGRATREPVSAGPLLLAATARGLHALDRASGEPRWRAATDLDLFPPRVIDGKAYAGSRQGAVVCIDLADGRELWRRWLEGWVYSPVVVAGLAITAGQGAEVYALSTADGHTRWQRALSQESVHRPLLVDEDVVLTTFDGGVERRHADTGHRVWRIGELTPATTPVLIGHTLVYARLGGFVVARDAADGSLRWQRRLSGGRLHAPRAAGGHVSIAGEDGSVHLLDVADGAEVARIKARNTPLDSPALAGRSLLLATRAGLERHSLPQAAAAAPSPRAPPGGAIASTLTHLRRTP